MEEEELSDEKTSPLCALTISVPAMQKLGHRAYMGSLMGLGMNRAKFGDILLQESGAQIILLREVLLIVESQWEKAGRVPVHLAPLPLRQLSPKEQSLRPGRDTVASLRLDNVLSAVFSLSRNRAAQLIGEGRVQRNHRPCEQVTQAVE